MNAPPGFIQASLYCNIQELLKIPYSFQELNIKENTYLQIKLFCQYLVLHKIMAHQFYTDLFSINRSMSFRKGEFQICPRMDFDNILYVEYIHYNNYKNEIISFLEGC